MRASRWFGSYEGAQGVAPDTFLTTIGDEALLEFVWKKKLRKLFLSTRLGDFHLDQDPVQFLAHEWGLKELLQSIGHEVRTGTYTPRPAAIVRAAKSTGLSRPLAFPCVEDAIVLRAITARAEPALLRREKAWTGAFKEDKGRLAKVAEDLPAGSAPAQAPIELRGDGMAGEERTVAARTQLEDLHNYANDWFSMWMAQQGVIKRILDRKRFVVETDISNFFPSLELEVVREHLLSASRLDRDVARLAVQILGGVLPHPQYADSPSMGLPQEPTDASRAIAHSLLVDVDEEFEEEGRAGLYSRYMDDVVVGVDDIESGERVVKRWQLALEPVGLYPNVSKTRIVTTDRLVADMMVHENALIDALEAEVIGYTRPGQMERVTAPVDFMRAVEVVADYHRLLSGKPTHWDRVLVRYYTMLRSLGVDSWRVFVEGHIYEHPARSAQILEYVRAFPLTRPGVAGLTSVVTRFSGLYDDVPLLALETLLTAPVSDRTLYGDISAFALQTMRQHVDGEQHSIDDRIAAACLPLVAKFGAADAIADALELAYSAPPTSLVRLHAYPVANAAGSADSGLRRAGLGRHAALVVEFCDAVAKSEAKALGVVLGKLNADARMKPRRWFLPFRPVVLAQIASRAAPRRIAAAAQRAGAKLELNEGRLRDHRVEEHLAALAAGLAK